MISSARPATARPPDEGVSVIEVLIAIGLFACFGSIALGMAISTNRATSDVQQIGIVGEETRAAMERMARELRQAATLKAVHLPSAENDGAEFTLWVDFNGNGCVDASAGDPEMLTYTWEPATARLVLSASVSGRDESGLVVAAKVTSFALELSSSAWQYDANMDGITTWQELDRSSIGDNRPRVFHPEELKRIDLVGVAMTATDGSHTARFSTSVTLRNRNLEVDTKAC